jgi:hypothetical protein
MVTLHAYVLRELLKSFGLTVLALTALFSMGGGLYNVVQVEGVTAGDLFTVLPMLIPIVITLTMPIAALFAATMAYGRLAADNELVAVRAAGINVHRLFLPAVLLSIFVALFSAVSANLVIPRFMKQIEHFARSNVRDLAYHRLLRRGYLAYGDPGDEQYMLTAQAVLDVPRSQLVEKGFDPPGGAVSYFWVKQPTFLMIDKQGELKRFSVAEGGLCQFNTRAEQIEFTVYIKNARDYEVGKRVVQIEQQKIGPYAREIPFSPKPSMVDLKTLRQWRAAPWKAPRLRREIDEFLDRLRAYIFSAETARLLEADQTLVLYDIQDARYEFEAASCTPGRGELACRDATVARHASRGGGLRDAPLPTRYEAPEARLRARPPDNGEPLIELTLSATPEQPVLEYNPRVGDYHMPRQKDSVRLDDLRLPTYVGNGMRACTPAAVINAAAELPTDAELEDDRAELQRSADRMRRKVNGVIHFRLGFSSSALVTVLMGALLGVIFRGARALAAFGLACIPFGVVTILTLMGRQLTENAPTEDLGPFVIWGGLALVALADGAILRLGVRR